MHNQRQIESLIALRFSAFLQSGWDDNMDKRITRQVELITYYCKLDANLCAGVLIDTHPELCIKSLILRHRANFPGECAGIDTARLEVGIHRRRRWNAAAGNVVDAIRKIGIQPNIGEWRGAGAGE